LLLGLAFLLDAHLLICCSFRGCSHGCRADICCDAAAEAAARAQPVDQLAQDALHLPQHLLAALGPQALIDAAALLALVVLRGAQWT
jgi:hypothetical protein